MKRFCFFYLLPLFCLLLSCGEKEKGTAARLSGTIEGLGDDTVYVIGLDRLFDRVDTLLVQDGKWTDTLSVDTLVAVRLLFSDGTEYPLYADRRQRISIRGTADRLDDLEVTGSPENELQTAFQRSLDSLGTSSAPAVQDLAEKFIRTHPTSLVCLYLLDTYFVQTPQPDYERIGHLIEPLRGDLKDRPYLSELQEVLDERNKWAVGRTIPFFQAMDAEGNRVMRSQFKDKCLLVNVWASWDEKSRMANDSLRALYRRQKKNKDFAMLGISLDTDRAQWQAAVRQDTLDWKQTCDLKGWKSDFVQKLPIRSLPFQVLVDKNGHILGVNLTMREVEEKIKKEASSPAVTGKRPAKKPA